MIIFTFIMHHSFYTIILALVLDSLVRVSRRVNENHFVNITNLIGVTNLYHITLITNTSFAEINILIIIYIKRTPAKPQIVKPQSILYYL